MSLQTVLAGIDASWYAGEGEPPPDAALVRRARGSALGERILARWLAQADASALLAPQPSGGIGQVAVRWPTAMLSPLLRDLGVLAMAPAIRAEVGRDAVRRLKHLLGNSYLLALDRTVWDGKIDAGLAQRLHGALVAALKADTGDGVALYALLERQGRSELRQWARDHAPALAEWTTVAVPRTEVDDPAVLPEAPVRMLHEHHLARTQPA